LARILLIETATEVCSAAIAEHGQIIAMAEEANSTNHAALLTLQIGQCCMQSGIPLADLDAVAVSSGPGSYTSLRVGASVAKGICYALDKPLLTVDTLLSLAMASGSETEQSPDRVYIPMIDARRQEVWLSVYDAAFKVLLPAQPFIIHNNLFNEDVLYMFGPQSGKVAILSGNGMFKAENAIDLQETVFSKIKKCSAEFLVKIAEMKFQNADYQNVGAWVPYYMKPPNITKPHKVL
jgi:tRNA threonylcarbamoyladenosine biosynthesis protein TsaB